MNLAFFLFATAAADIARDAPYLHAVAAVHEFCAEDFERFCGGDHHRRRRLTEEVLVSVTAFDLEEEEEDGEVDHSAAGPPLALGRRADMCLRRNFDRLSTACATSIAVVDNDTDYYSPPPSRPCFLWLLLALLVVPLCCVARRNKFKEFVDAIRNDEKLLPLVERSAGPLPETNHKARCCRTLWMCLAAIVAGYALTLALGPTLALLFVWAVVVPAALLNHCLLKARYQASIDEPSSDYVPLAASDNAGFCKEEEQSSGSTETDDHDATAAKKLLI